MVSGKMPIRIMFPGYHTIFGHQYKHIKLGFFHLLAFWASSFSCFSNLTIFSNSLTFGELSPSNVIISFFKSACCCSFNWLSNSVNMNQWSRPTHRRSCKIFIPGQDQVAVQNWNCYESLTSHHISKPHAISTCLFLLHKTEKNYLPNHFC